jgi:hypothetical protein
LALDEGAQVKAFRMIIAGPDYHSVRIIVAQHEPPERMGAFRRDGADAHPGRT